MPSTGSSSGSQLPEEFEKFASVGRAMAAHG